MQLNQHFQNLLETENKTLETTKTSTSQSANENPCPENEEKSSQIDKECELSKVMKQSLSDVLHEGLLDSVLPYMIPRTTFSQPVIKKTQTLGEPRKSISLADNKVSNFKDKDKEKSRRKSFEFVDFISLSFSIQMSFSLTIPYRCEIEIHVCDEAKNIKKDFRCPQRLLIQNMCYFADVTAGQKLEEMDISVHCDIVIFDWLMRWVKKDIIKKSDWPVLEASNVVPIMVSASFLQMEPLLNSCLLFCHDNMTEILKTSAIFTCLNDALLSRYLLVCWNVTSEIRKLL